jgi:hypothetical protein
MATVTLNSMKTRKLTANQKDVLLGVLNSPHWPNECRFEEGDTYTTRGGNLGCRKYDRRSNEGLFDSGLLEAIRVEGYTYDGGWPAAGILSVTAKGLAAIESGKYQVEEKTQAEKSAQPSAPRFNPYKGLSPIVKLIGIDDAGEFGAAVCPCCGALGRYTYVFQSQDGETHGAMRGCFGKYPKHRFLEESQRIAEKVKDNEELARRRGKAQNLASWDVEIVEAIDAFLAGTISEATADEQIHAAKRRKATWCRKRYGR